MYLSTAAFQSQEIMMYPTREKQRTSWDLRRVGQVRESNLQRHELLPRHRALCLLVVKSLVLDNFPLGHRCPLLLQCCQTLWNSTRPLDPGASGQLAIMHQFPQVSPTLWDQRTSHHGEIKTFFTYLLILQLLLWSKFQSVYIKF